MVGVEEFCRVFGVEVIGGDVFEVGERLFLLCVIVESAGGGLVCVDCFVRRFGNDL